eukprot:1512379-Prymnesium_polylepis.1
MCIRDRACAAARRTVGRTPRNVHAECLQRTGRLAEAVNAYSAALRRSGCPRGSGGGGGSGGGMSDSDWATRHSTTGYVF